MTDDPGGVSSEHPHTGSAGSGHHANPALQTISFLRGQLDSLEKQVGSALGQANDEGHHLSQPGWKRRSPGEARPPVAVAVAIAILLQVVLPDRLVFKPTWLLPVLEAVLLIGLIVSDPRRIERSSVWLRYASLTLIAIISIANAFSAVELVREIVLGTGPSNPRTLLGSGAAIYLTNIIVFGLWYWELDRGGPVARAQGGDRHPDFMFVQMDKTQLASPDWKPLFLDYCWLSYTNATAFSPTDTMPLSRAAKATMFIQSAVSLVTVALVVARAVNILK
ncbi:MAG: hypothetical protein ACRD0I_09335 [Acidimicrobiales bacterium]